MPTAPSVLIPLAAICLPAIIVPVSVYHKLQTRKRELLHQERMEALRMGMTPPPDPTMGAGTLAAIGAGVPCASFLFATLATVGIDMDTVSMRFQDFLLMVWGSACMVSLCGMFTCVVLAFMQNRERNRFYQASDQAHAKPSYDPDAFDLAGRRGI